MTDDSIIAIMNLMQDQSIQRVDMKIGSYSVVVKRMTDDPLQVRIEIT